MKIEYVFALATLLCCLIIGSAQAEPVQASSESKAVDNRSVPDGAPAYTVPSGAIVPPSELSTTKPVEKGAPGITLPSGPMATDLIGGVQSPTKPDDVPLVTTLPDGAIVAPGGELLGAQNATKSTPVTTVDEPARFPSVVFVSATAIGGLTALVWWRKRKNKKHKKSIRRQSSYHLYERQGR